MKTPEYMKLVNVPFNMLQRTEGYVLGLHKKTGTITRFHSGSDGKHFDMFMDITWSDGRQATYIYPDDVASLLVNKSMHGYNNDGWVKFQVNRLRRHIRSLQKTLVPDQPDDFFDDPTIV